MLIRFLFCVLCTQLVVLGQADPSISLCDAVANNSIACVGLAIPGEYDTCPNRPSNPCCVNTVCEYNANGGILMPWNPQTYTWQMRGFVTQAVPSTIRSLRFAKLEPGQQGYVTQRPVIPGGFVSKICEKRFMCVCNTDEPWTNVTCDSIPCGELLLWNLTRGPQTCTVGGGGGGPVGGGGIE